MYDRVLKYAQQIEEEYASGQRRRLNTADSLHKHKMASAAIGHRLRNWCVECKAMFRWFKSSLFQHVRRIINV